MRATIPATSTTRYLSGRPALNLISEDGTGDWHFVQTFCRDRVISGRFAIVGEGCETNTNTYLGNAGIYDCTALLDEQRIQHESTPAFAANHARAIADMVIAESLLGRLADFAILDDWMPRPRDKQKVYDLLAQAKAKLPELARKMVLEWEAANSERE